MKDFTAKGNGMTDDTEAIQRAFDAGRGRAEPSPGEDYSAYYVELSPLIFPIGKHQISDTLEIRNNGRFRGESAAIHQTNPDKDIFQYTNA